MDFISINWLAAVVAALSSFGVGFLWYGPLFGKPWQKLIGLSDEDMKNANMGKIFGTAFIFTLIGAVVLATMIPAGTGLLNGMLLGLTVGVGFAATALGINYQFARHPFNLWLIDGGYIIIVYVVMGLILGAWS